MSDETATNKHIAEMQAEVWREAEKEMLVRLLFGEHLAPETPPPGGFRGGLLGDLGSVFGSLCAERVSIGSMPSVGGPSPAAEALKRCAKLHYSQLVRARDPTAQVNSEVDIVHPNDGDCYTLMDVAVWLDAAEISKDPSVDNKLKLMFKTEYDLMLSGEVKYIKYEAETRTRHWVRE